MAASSSAAEREKMKMEKADVTPGVPVEEEEGFEKWFEEFFAGRGEARRRSGNPYVWRRVVGSTHSSHVSDGMGRMGDGRGKANDGRGNGGKRRSRSKRRGTVG